MIRIFGLLIPINQKDPGDAPPFEISDEDPEDFLMVRNGEGWALLWVLRKDGFEFGVSANWAYNQGVRITREFILPKFGYQAGECQVVMFELDRDDELDIEMLVERFDWTTGVEPPC